MSNITLNIVEPGSGPTPDPVVPNTGLFTSGIGGPEATVIVSIGLFLIIATVLIVYLLHKKKVGRVTALQGDPHTSGYGGKQSWQDPSISKPKKLTSIGLVSLALLASAGTLTTLLANAGKSNTNAVEEDGLTLDVAGGDLTIEVGSDPVFAVAEVKATVKEATEAGYTLTAFTDSTDLVSTTDSSKVIPMVAADEGELVALTNNTYGLTLDEEPTTKDAEVYMPLSTDSSAPTILKATDYVETEANDTTTIYYGFYITPDMPYGTYTGSDIYYDVEPHYITNLSFDGNGNDGGEEIKSRIIPAGNTITLPENTYTKEGYNFIGWNTVAEPTEQDPGEAYADQAEYTAVEGETKDVTLYAQWKKLPVIGDLTYMQDFATLSEAEKTSVLNSMTEGAEYQLKDNRDQTLYYIAKLADGHVWMTQNLDLSLSTEVTLTPANTNITKDWKPDNSTIAIQDGSFPGWENSINAPYSADPGDVYYYTTGNSDNETATDKATCEQAHQDGSCPHYHAGNYYNWSAAVAMNDTSEYGDDDQYVNVETSICPAGWRLPTGRDRNNTAASREWNAVLYAEGVASSPTDDGYTSDGFNKIRTAPLWLARSGYVYDGSLSVAGYGGYYWSSTVGESSGAYLLNFDSGNVYPAFSNGRVIGYSVRCVAQ